MSRRECPRAVAPTPSGCTPPARAHATPPACQGLMRSLLRAGGPCTARSTSRLQGFKRGHAAVTWSATHTAGGGPPPRTRLALLLVPPHGSAAGPATGRHRHALLVRARRNGSSGGPWAVPDGRRLGPSTVGGAGARGKRDVAAGSGGGRARAGKGRNGEGAGPGPGLGARGVGRPRRGERRDAPPGRRCDHDGNGRGGADLRARQAGGDRPQGAGRERPGRGGDRRGGRAAWNRDDNRRRRGRGYAGPGRNRRGNGPLRRRLHRRRRRTGRAHLRARQRLAPGGEFLGAGGGGKAEAKGQDPDREQRPLREVKEAQERRSHRGSPRGE